MAKNMRVHELAKELGMTNAEAMDLATALGVPVKSHSSSLNEAYADMIRRRAVRDGLTREEQPEEPKPAKKPAKKAAAKRAEPEVDKTAEPAEVIAPDDVVSVAVESAPVAEAAPAPEPVAAVEPPTTPEPAAEPIAAPVVEPEQVTVAAAAPAEPVEPATRPVRSERPAVSTQVEAPVFAEVAARQTPEPVTARPLEVAHAERVISSGRPSPDAPARAATDRDRQRPFRRAGSPTRPGHRRRHSVGHGRRTGQCSGPTGSPPVTDGQADPTATRPAAVALWSSDPAPARQCSTLGCRRPRCARPTQRPAERSTHRWPAASGRSSPGWRVHPRQRPSRRRPPRSWWTRRTWRSSRWTGFPAEWPTSSTTPRPQPSSSP